MKGSADMAIQGIVTPLVANGNVIGDDWVVSMRTISPRLSFARCSIQPDKSGKVQISQYQTAIKLLRASHIDVWGVLESALGPSNTNPNAELGFEGNPFLNQWTNGWTLRSLSVARQLNLSVVWAGNEPNLQAARNYDDKGVVIPQLFMGDTVDPRKGGALDPRVYFGALYQLGLRAKKLAPRLSVIIPASFSVNSKFNTSQYDGWIGDYIDIGMKYLADHGARPPWPWSGLSMNIEGAPNANYVGYTMSGYAKHKSDHSITGPTYVGEWSVPNSSLDVEVMKSSFNNLDSRVYAMAFFAFNTLVPSDAGNYGCVTYGFRDGLFIPQQKTKWYSALGGMLSAEATPVPQLPIFPPIKVGESS